MMNKELEREVAYCTILNDRGDCDQDMFVTYRHYRDVDYREDLWGDEIRATGGVTFCVAAEPDSELLHISVAECNTQDRYNKKIGRAVTFGRFARTGEYVTVPWDREITIAENLEANWQLFELKRNFYEVVLTGKYYQG